MSKTNKPNIITFSKQDPYLPGPMPGAYLPGSIIGFPGSRGRTPSSMPPKGTLSAMRSPQNSDDDPDNRKLAARLVQDLDADFGDPAPEGDDPFDRIVAEEAAKAKRERKRTHGAKTPIGEAKDDREPDWRKPDPLPDGLLPVAPFDMAFLPTSLAPWVADIAELMQCPADYVAIPAMVALDATIGRKIAVRPQRNTDWSEVANLGG